MSVYVDESQYPYGRMIMCHMVGDSEAELHVMARKIGIARRWFQTKHHPHYDICKSKRALAVKLGAVEVDRRGIVEVMDRARRGQGLLQGAALPTPKPMS